MAGKSAVFKREIHYHYQCPIVQSEACISRVLRQRAACVRIKRFSSHYMPLFNNKAIRMVLGRDRMEGYVNRVNLRNETKFNLTHYNIITFTVFIYKILQNRSP